MKEIQRRHVTAVVLVLIVAFSSCAKRPPNLTPQANVAFDSARVQGALDQIRDVVQVANAQVPPLVSTDDARSVTKWHRSAIVTLHARTDGWQSVVTVGLDELVRDVSPGTASILGPYVALVKAILNEVK